VRPSAGGAGPVPANVVVAEFVPQAAVLQRADLVTGDPAFRTAARRIGEQIAAMPDTDAAWAGLGN
jgi:hypothetical protein